MPTRPDWYGVPASGKLRHMRRDPIELEIFKNLYHSIAEEMGAALRRTAFSPNIKERRDYSCAVFDSAGEVIAMGDHMPVHLGSMPMSVRAAIAAGEIRALPAGDPGIREIATWLNELFEWTEIMLRIARASQADEFRRIVFLQRYLPRQYRQGPQMRMEV